MTVTQLKEKNILLKLRFTFDNEKRKNLYKQIEEIWFESRFKTADEEDILIVYKLEFYAVLAFTLSNILLGFLTTVSTSLTLYSAN